uniref:Chitin-binding type-2 domain-containing protein n=1 Tax=Steinernema glaseri TaxID=37863 RepID=A0A1I8AW92_9BILA
MYIKLLLIHQLIAAFLPLLPAVQSVDLEGRNATIELQSTSTTANVTDTSTITHSTAHDEHQELRANSSLMTPLLSTEDTPVSTQFTPTTIETQSPSTTVELPSAMTTVNVTDILTITDSTAHEEHQGLWANHSSMAPLASTEDTPAINSTQSAPTTIELQSPSTTVDVTDTSTIAHSTAHDEHQEQRANSSEMTPLLSTEDMPNTSNITPSTTPEASSSPFSTTTGHSQGTTQSRLVIQKMPEFNCRGMYDGYYSSGCGEVYFSCIGQRGFVRFCPVGLKFSQETRLCDFKERVPECGGSIPQPAVPQRSEPEAPQPKGPLLAKPDHHNLSQSITPQLRSDFSAVTSTNAPVQTTHRPILPIYVPYVEADRPQSIKPKPQHRADFSAVTSTNAPVRTTGRHILPIYVPYVEADSCFAKIEGIYSDGSCNRNYYACIQNGSEMTKFDFKCEENEVYDMDTHKCLKRASLRLCAHH